MPDYVVVPLPIHPYFEKVNSPYGDKLFGADALQPAGYALQFDISDDSGKNWTSFWYWGPYVEDQQVFASFYTYGDNWILRAYPIPPDKVAIKPAALSGNKCLLPSGTKGIRKTQVEPPYTRTQLMRDILQKPIPPIP